LQCVKRCYSRNLTVFWGLILLCISIFDFVQIDSRAQSAASTPSEEASLQAVDENYFPACGKKDLAGVVALWSEMSPNLAASPFLWPSSPPAQAIASERSAAQSSQEIVSLEHGKPIERELSGGQSHSHKVMMTSGQYLQVVVKQKGIDVALALFTPDGKKVVEADSYHLLEESESISAISEAAGAYLIEVRSPEKTAKTGRYEVRVEELRAATAEDKYQLAGEEVIREAERLQNDETLEAKRKSVEKYYEAAELFRKSGAGAWQAFALTSVGAIYESMGEMRKALEKYTESLPLRRAAGDRDGEAVALNNIGVTYWALGETRKALEKYDESLQLRRAIGDRNGQAATLNNIGAVYLSLGEAQKALEKYTEALPLRRAVGDRRGEAVALNNIGYVYHSLGEMRKALEKYDEALQLRRAGVDRRGEADTLNRIGMVYQSLGEAQKALEKYDESLQIKRAIGDRRGEADTLNNIGAVYQSPLGEPWKALEKYDEALPLRRALGDRRGEASTLNNIGVAYNSLGETRKALEKFNEALPIFQEVGDRRGEAGVLRWIAQVEQKRGNLPRAHQAVEQAVSLIESMRTNIVSQGLRASYFASRHEFFESYIGVLMQLHKQNPAAMFDADALAVSERARARSLLELLGEARADIRQGIDGSLLERERSLQQLLNAKAGAQFALLNRKHTPAQAEAAAKEIAALTDEYEEIRAQIRKSSPRYAALTQPQPLSLTEIQQQTLDPDTLLLEYSLGDDASYLFVVSHTSITSYELPKRSEIEAATRRAYELLTAPQPRPGETEAKLQARIKEANASYWPQAAALSQMLLGPAASQLGSKRLLIVADGALQYLPFGALPVPDPKASTSPRLGFDSTPLMVEHEIVHLPSASALAVLRRELAGRQPASKAVAVLADPVFSADDARVKPGGKAQAGEETPSDLTRAVNDVRGELGRLLMTRDEAEAILSVTPRNGGLAALDFRANRATATSDELSNYRIVHFATHGLLNSEHPELSGLALSLVDEQGRPQDGFLRLHEIFNLRLPAELVVLSACRTGLGKEVKGEGLVGLTRGFMYAGASRVVASLWRVDDAATAELMKRFYRRMLQDGMRPAAALRAAQIEMWKKPQWQSPYYWGGFVLQGEWK